jgi:hypothetical protein
MIPAYRKSQPGSVKMIGNFVKICKIIPTRVVGNSWQSAEEQAHQRYSAKSGAIKRIFPFAEPG